MILCRTCRRLWPKGSMYCGSCGGSLGKRLCPESHESPLSAMACTTCGSRKLTRGSPALSLRFASTILGLALGSWTLTVFGPILVNYLWAQLQSALWFVLTPLINLVFWSLILSLFVGDRGRQMISELWANLLRWPFRMLEWAIKAGVSRRKARKGSEGDRKER